MAVPKSLMPYHNGEMGGCSHRLHYDSRADAQRAAEQMGLSGTHTMQCDMAGGTVYMPGSSHSKLEQALNATMPGMSMGMDMGQGGGGFLPGM